MRESIELVVINDHTEVNEDRKYETCYFINEDSNLKLKDSGKYVEIKGRKLLEIDSDLYFLNPKDYTFKITENAKRYLGNASEDTEIVLLTYECIHRRDLGAQSVIARFYGPKIGYLS